MAQFLSTKLTTCHLPALYGSHYSARFTFQISFTFHFYFNVNDALQLLYSLILKNKCNVSIKILSRNIS